MLQKRIVPTELREEIARLINHGLSDVEIYGQLLLVILLI